MPPELHRDPAIIDWTQTLADKEAIRAINPQRFELEQIDAIVYEDNVNHVIAGYKDLRADEFWTRGHMPGYPIFPGVLLCEAAAQICAFYMTKNKLVAGDFFGFGGLENVRFRGSIHPGDRLLLIGKASKINRRMTIFNVQGFVGESMVFHGDILGLPMMREKEDPRAPHNPAAP